MIKANQPTVWAEIRELFAPETPTVLGNLVPTDVVRYEKAGKGHGRRERRRIIVSSESKGYIDWPSLEQVFRLERSPTW